MEQTKVDEVPQLKGAGFFADPYPVYARLREARVPVFDEATESWLISRFTDVESLLRDARISKGVQRPVSTPFETSVLFRDPPDHGRIRSVLNQAFAATVPGRLEECVEQIADGLIDRMLAAGSADFIRDFALPLPVAVIGRLLGIAPADLDQLQYWSSAFIAEDGVPRSEIEQKQYAAIVGMEAYFEGMMRNAAKSGGQGIVASLAQAREQGVISRDELIGNCILLMVAGHETTVNLLGNGLQVFLSEPGLMDCLRQNPKLLATAIEEVLRFESPVQLGTFRLTTAPLEVGGTTIAAGSRVTALLGAANRDPEQFPDPNRFDPTRTPNRHLGFGLGIHLCIGASLARSEARIGFSRLMERLPGLQRERIAGPASWFDRGLGRLGLKQPALMTPQPEWRHNAVTRGLRDLKVRF